MGDRNQNLNDPETAFRSALDGRQAQIWTTMPGIITKVNLARMTCEVQLAIQVEITNPDASTSVESITPLLDVPIVFPSAGGFTLTFPLSVDDEVLVHIASRCIDAWFQQGGVQPQAEMRMHDLSDGFCVPGIKSQPNVISSISTTNVQLRSNSGSCYLEITPTGMINLVAPGGVNITGNLSVSGLVSAVGEVTGNLIPLSLHTHISETPGTPTSPPVA